MTHQTLREMAGAIEQLRDHQQQADQEGYEATLEAIRAHYAPLAAEITRLTLALDSAREEGRRAGLHEAAMEAAKVAARASASAESFPNDNAAKLAFLDKMEVALGIELAIRGLNGDAISG